MCQVIFVCTYGAHNIHYNIQNGAGLQKRKSGKEIVYQNFKTRISSFTTAYVCGNTGCDTQHKSLQGLKIKYIYEAIDGADYTKR